MENASARRMRVNLAALVHETGNEENKLTAIKQGV
jgi:hypothetical protein